MVKLLKKHIKLVTKPSLKTEIIPLLVILITLIAAGYFYSVFPAQAPIHWNIAGQPDDWGSKTLAAFLMPLISVGLYLLLLFLPNLDPRRDRYQEFLPAYHWLKNILIIFLALIYLAASLNALGHNLPIDLLVPGLVGFLFVLIGFYLPKFKSNWFVGIRTPWTLSSEISWQKTHILGGRLFILAGLAMVITGLLPIAWRWTVFIAVVVVAALVPILYSYFIYKKDKNKL